MNMQILGSIVCAAIATGAHAGTVLYTQDFESNTGFSTTSQWNPPSSQTQFLTTNTSTLHSTGYANADGTFIAGLNTNFFNGVFDTPVVTTDNIDISTQLPSSAYQFSIDLATNNATPQWSLASLVKFEYQIDSGTWLELFTADSDGVNYGNPLINGIAITNDFSNFSGTINNITGSTLSFRVVWENLSTLESLAIDNITVSVVPLPPTALAGFGLLAGLGAYRRYRK